MYWIYIILAILLGIIPAKIAEQKGKPFAVWWLFGAALFIVALPMALIIEPEPAALEKQKLKTGFVKCPFCAEFIKKEAKVCRFCGRDIPADVSRSPARKTSSPVYGRKQKTNSATLSVPMVPTSSGWVKPQESNKTTLLRVPSSLLDGHAPQKQVRLSASDLATISRKRSENAVTQCLSQKSTKAKPETKTTTETNVSCPHCQAPIDISGLPPGKYDCPNCHGEIELA